MTVSGKRILVVEDEAGIREMIRFALQRESFEVIEAGDVPEGRVCVADGCPDLILLDWMLPGTSGVDYARELKSDPTTRDIPLIMVTARAEEEDTVRGLNVGADDYITKPFSFPELVARIQAVLRRSLPGGESECIQVSGLSVDCLLYTSPSPRDGLLSRMPSSA